MPFSEVGHSSICAKLLFLRNSSLSSKVRHPVIETNMDSYYEIDRKLS